MPYQTLSDSDLAVLDRLKRLERLLDRQFAIGGVRFGVDSIVGLVPVVGDIITGALGLYVISEARRIGVSRWTLARMYANWGVDVGIGAVPIVGDLFDLAFKSNTKNVRMLIAELERRERRSGREATPVFDRDIIEHEPFGEPTAKNAAGGRERKPSRRGQRDGRT